MSAFMIGDDLNLRSHPQGNRTIRLLSLWFLLREKLA